MGKKIDWSKPLPTPNLSFRPHLFFVVVPEWLGEVGYSRELIPGKNLQQVIRRLYGMNWLFFHFEFAIPCKPFMEESIENKQRRATAEFLDKLRGEGD